VQVAKWLVEGRRGIYCTSPLPAKGYSRRVSFRKGGKNEPDVKGNKGRLKVKGGIWREELTKVTVFLKAI
jgi:hypothetical protein